MTAAAEEGASLSLPVFEPLIRGFNEVVPKSTRYILRESNARYIKEKSQGTVK